jgi:hypothetical protein
LWVRVAHADRALFDVGSEVGVSGDGLRVRGVSVEEGNRLLRIVRRSSGWW